MARGGGREAANPEQHHFRQRRHRVHKLQDGVFNMNTGCQCGSTSRRPSTRFRIGLEGQFQRQISASGSANIMVETKSGTNAFHGADEYLRNDVSSRNF
jgi:hypothetical protein